MNIEHMGITFNIKSSDLADILSKYVVEIKEAETEEGESIDDSGVFICDERIIGVYYSFEDEYGEAWELIKKVPDNGHVVKWILDVMVRGGFISETGKTIIEDNIDSIEAGIEDYALMHYRCSPQGDNYVYYQKYDGQQIVTYHMDIDLWESMWNDQYIEQANTLFERHGYKMQVYRTSSKFIGNTFFYFKDKPILIELLEAFGEKKVEEKVAGDEIEVWQSKNNELLAELKQWIVSPEMINYEEAIVGLRIYNMSMLKPYEKWGEKMCLCFFVESSLKLLGAAYNNADVNSKTNVAILIRNYEDYSKDYDICEYYNIDSIEERTMVYGGDPIIKKNLSDKEYYIGKLVVFNHYLDGFLKEFNHYNSKRITAKKPKPPIKIVYEDQWFNYLISLDRDPVYHEKRQLIAKELIASSPYVAGDNRLIKDIYDARPEGRKIDL